MHFHHISKFVIRPLIFSGHLAASLLSSTYSESFRFHKKSCWTTLLLRDGRTQNLKELAPSLELEICVTVKTCDNCVSSIMYFTVEILPFLSVTCGKGRTQPAGGPKYKRMHCSGESE